VALGGAASAAAGVQSPSGTGKVAEIATQHLSIGYLAAALHDKDGDGALADNQLNAAMRARPRLHVQGPGQMVRGEHQHAAQLLRAHNKEQKAMQRQEAVRHLDLDGGGKEAGRAAGGGIRGTAVIAGPGVQEAGSDVAPALREELLGVRQVAGGVDEKLEATGGARGGGRTEHGGSGGVHTLIRPSSVDAAAAVAIVGVRGRFSSKTDLERVFYSRLLECFDGDKDGQLVKEELLMGLSALSHGDINGGLGMDDKGINELFARLDIDGSGALEESELLRYLRSAEFQSSRVAGTIMAYVLDGQGGVEEMMTGFKQPNVGVVGKLGEVKPGGVVMAGAEALDTLQELYALERRTGMVVKEHIPGYVRMALNMLYKAGDLAKLSGVKAALSQFSAHEGHEKNDPESASTIADFIAQFGIDESEMELPVEAFSNFN